MVCELFDNERIGNDVHWRAVDKYVVELLAIVVEQCLQSLILKELD